MYAFCSYEAMADPRPETLNSLLPEVNMPPCMLGEVQEKPKDVQGKDSEETADEPEATMPEDDPDFGLD
jgi:hypothetical protein